MKRIFLILAIFSCFLILSMSFIPSAQKNIIDDEIESNIDDNINEFDDIKLIFNNMVMDKIEINDDCDCLDENSNTAYPIICFILFILYTIFFNICDIQLSISEIYYDIYYDIFNLISDFRQNHPILGAFLVPLDLLLYLIYGSIFLGALIPAGIYIAFLTIARDNFFCDWAIEDINRNLIGV